MEIHTKMLKAAEGHAINRIYTIERLFKYAAEVLGDGWKYTLGDDDFQELIFTDSTGSGEHGWRCYAENNSSGYGSTMVSNDVRHDISKISDIVEPLDTFTALVWKTSGGSVGIGIRDDDGRYKTWFLLIKFNGKYDNHDVYGIACNHADVSRGSVWIHGITDIRSVNQCYNSAIGSGVYLHPFYDPISGLASTDVFGAQSMESDGYALNGMIVKQGGVSYLSVLGGVALQKNTENVLFVKM